MPTYRVYFLDDAAHVTSPPIILDCADDEEAKRQARQYIDGKVLELWLEGTMIGHFPKR